ncbi:MAG: GNAT family N-acetyltransferase [Clostridia bacterium]|nr:GNAT family N-acetyltransferase [Clostridia bacterium]
MCAVTEVLTVGRDLDADAAFALHTACFGDTREWFDAFLDAAAGQQYLAAMHRGKLCGGAFLLDACLFVNRKEYKGKYAYALGVSPAYRGQGIARMLLDAAKELSSHFTLICAADEKLAKTYEKHGFDRYVGGTVQVGAARGVQMDTSAYKTPCTYADAVQCGGVFLGEKLFAFALEECGAALYTDGKSVIVKSAGGVYAAYGLPAAVERKAQMHVKKEIDTSSIHADLILEVE